MYKCLYFLFPLIQLVEDADLESDKFLITVEYQEKEGQNPNGITTAGTTNVQSKSVAPFVNKKVSDE